MSLIGSLQDKLPPWPVTTVIVLASIGAFIGLVIAKRRTGKVFWAKSRNRTSETFALYLGSFVTAMLITFVSCDWIAIDSIPLERADYAYAQQVEGVCAFALFFTIFFGSALQNKLTWPRLILTLIPGVIFTACLVIIHNAK